VEKNWPLLWQSYHIWTAAIVSGVLIAVCYGFVLQLPFFFDDLPTVTWLHRHNLVDIWTRSSISAYYRPVVSMVYELGLLFPMGVRQVVLHAIPLLVHWMNALLIIQIVKLCDESINQASLAGILFAVFPFLFLAIPWITALPHLLVTLMVLVATYAALRAERDKSTTWWGISLLATTFAPFVHENGSMCGLIVGGIVVIQHGIRPERRCIIGISSGVLLSVGAVLLRNLIPNVERVRLLGSSDWLGNAMFFLHGLVYPVAPVIGRLMRQQGWQDLTLIGISAVLFALVLMWLARRSGNWRWVARGLWLWGCGALPAAVSLKFGDLFISPRFHTLASTGVAMLWAGVIVELGQVVRNVWGRRLIWGLLAGAIVIQNVAFLHRQRALLTSLNQVYQQILEAAQDKENEPLGFINVPDWLAYRTRTYPLITEGVVFVPPYSNVHEFVQVNLAGRAADWAMFTPVLQDTEQAFGFSGDGLTWEHMRQFAVDHRTVWLTFYRDGEFVLKQVGAITANATSPPEPLVRFTDGPVIESASVHRVRDGEWALTLIWWASGPVDGDIFVHVRDANHDVVAQVDGPALGRMVPIWLWQPGDRIYDIRYIDLPDNDGSYTVQAGVYNAQGRFPAFVDDVRVPDDAVPVATIVP
jgi:hypothetical protein